MLNKPTVTLIYLSLLLSAAIFGFFYAWICSTMWGLDATDPRIAIEAMQAMNGSVRNAVFAPAFFGTPIALGVTAFMLRRARCNKSSLLFSLSAGIYLFFGLILTMAINVPMNEALGALSVPQDINHAREIWVEYSGPWQFWNQTRAVASGISFLFAVAGVLTLSRRPHPN
ncbi:anthrone oxygenase family protein [Sulfitobacter sp.]|uniref:anthrone oxygenase family protein n=1 Tax=Sulfitobacter sp. TaxID=1903071 RepID=UPI003002D904